MSDDKKHGDDDLLLEDISTNDPSMDEAERSEEDEVSTSLDLDPSQDEANEKAKRREAVVDQSARTWAARILTNKATMDDVPANHQYLIPKINELLGKKEDEVVIDPKELVRFELKKEKLKNLDLEPSQIKTLNEKFKFYRSKGWEQSEALDEAIAFANIDLNGVKAEMPKIKTGGSTPSKPKFEGTEDPSKMSRQELAAYIAHNKSMMR